jgi:O-antigen/teichoic acid export membrane protein
VATATTALIYFQSEFDRVMQIKHDRPWDPVATSLAFLLVNLGLGAAAALLQLPFLGFMAGLCAFCALKGLWLVATIARPRFRQGWRLLVRDLRGKMGWASLGAVAYGGYNHAPIFILGATAAPIHTAGFVAMRSLMQPLQVIIRSLDVVDKHLFGKASGASRSGMKRVFLRTLAIYGGFGALVALVVFVAGDAIVSLAYGAKYEGFHFTLVGWAVASMVMVMTAPIESVVFTAGRMRGYMSQRLIAGVVGVTAAAVLCPLFQDRGAIVATLIGWLVALGAGLWLALSILRRPAEEDAP